MSATDTVTVGRALPKLATVEPGNGPFDVSVTWAAGERVGRTDIVDLAPMIFTFKVFRPLRDNRALFQSVRVAEWGEALVWPENEDLEIGAESVEEMAAEVMTNADFAMFLKRNGFTLDAAAAHLGIARRLVAYYAKNRGIPRYIALACKQIDAMREPSVSADRREPAKHHAGGADAKMTMGDIASVWEAGGVFTGCDWASPVEDGGPDMLMLGKTPAVSVSSHIFSVGVSMAKPRPIPPLTHLMPTPKKVL